MAIATLTPTAMRLTPTHNPYGYGYRRAYYSYGYYPRYRYAGYYPYRRAYYRSASYYPYRW